MSTSVNSDEVGSVRSLDERKMSYKTSKKVSADSSRQLNTDCGVYPKSLSPPISSRSVFGSPHRRPWTTLTSEDEQRILSVDRSLDTSVKGNLKSPRRYSFDSFVHSMMVRVGSQSSVSSDDTFKKETYKMQKQKYHYEKRRVAQELLHTLKDPAIVVLADWLKIRGSLRKWMKVYCLLKPGMLLVYKSAKTHKHGYWIGTVLLASCELIERPSKKDGFCFKLFHPLDQSIWATRGPKGETFGAVTMPLPTSYLICRAPSDEAGRCWMDGLELALRCSNLLLRTMNKQAGSGAAADLSTPSSAAAIGADLEGDADFADASSDAIAKRQISETEAERHFAEAGLGEDNALSDSDNEAVFTNDEAVPPGPIVEKTVYIPGPPEVFGALGEAEQTEEVADENKSLIWALMKQLRPGMDLSKVVLPTFILEPRSFLEKLADFYYHSDLLGRAVRLDDPFQRMKAVVKFYLSGFYKKPKGLKKPFNPIIGEVFRCQWHHKDDSRTFYIAEQVSHHPPVSAFFVTNRKAGYNICGTILAKSKFYGNSLSAIMAGSAKLTLLTRGENYHITLPYAHCKGLILGTLTMELGGQVKITCDRTSYAAELEFKLKPLFGGSDSMNAIAGKIKLGGETLADIEGHWDSTIFITDRQTGTKELLWRADAEVIKERLKRFDVPVDKQEEFESQRLWAKVAEAIKNTDQVAATEEKTILEEAQRKRAKELRERNEVHHPRLFDLDDASGQYIYKHADYRPWDAQNDVEQYEGNFTVLTKSRHHTPLIRTSSLNSQLTVASVIAPVSADHEWSEDEDSPGAVRKIKSNVNELLRIGAFQEGLKPLRDDLDLTKRTVFHLREKVELITEQTKKQTDNQWIYFLILVAVFVAFQAVIVIMFKRDPNRVA